MEQSLIVKLKKLLLISLLVREVSVLYYGFSILRSVMEINAMNDIPMLSRHSYVSMFEFFTFELGILFALLFGLKLLFKNMHQSWSEIAVIFALLVFMPSWAAPLSIYGLYLLYKESPKVNEWIADFKI